MLRTGKLRDNQTCVHCKKAMYFTPNNRVIDNYDWHCLLGVVRNTKQPYQFRLVRIFKIQYAFKYIVTGDLPYFSDLQNVDIYEVVDIGLKVLTNLKGIIMGRIKKHFVQNPVKLNGPGVIIQDDDRN